MLAYTKSRFHEIRLRLENHAPTSRLNSWLWEFSLFVFKQGWACLFGGILLSLLLLTKWYWPPHFHLARYDFLFLAALAVQALLLLLRMETVREAKVILVFHIVGTLMELFKTNVGSWAYPEQSFFHIGHVPLFSGFMYASVGSYLARNSRIMDMRYIRYPNKALTISLAVLIYANFFTHHYLPDIRIGLFLVIAVTFGPTWVYYRPYRKYRRMPLLFGLEHQTLTQAICATTVSSSVLKTRTLSRPSFFARYNARSASCIRISAVIPLRFPVFAAPKLAVTRTVE